MNVTELVETMHDNQVPTAPDLDRITRQGRRIAVRRRAAVATVVVAAVAVVSGPWALLAGGRDHAVSPSGTATSTPFDDSREVAFETSAPLGAPVGDVAQTEMKFYLGPDHVRSVGALSLWLEAGRRDDELAYGARLIDKDGTLRRAGYLQVPVLPRVGGELVRIPDQNRGEPTFVGLIPVPAGADATDYRIRVRATDTPLDKGKSTTVVDGRLLVWVTALDQGRGLDLDNVVVRDASGDVVARGTFAD